MAQVTLSSKNQIVIPKEVREKLGLKPGDKIAVGVRDDGAYIFKAPKKYSEALIGIARGVYGPDYLKKERESWD